MHLPDLFGSPLSINALREDLQVCHQSVSRWKGMLENLYMIFRIYPFGTPKIRAVKKEAKHYHLDWTVVKVREYIGVFRGLKSESDPGTIFRS